MKKKLLRMMARLSIAACLVMALGVSAFATETGGSDASAVDISPVMDSITSGITGLVPTVLAGVGALAVAGLGIFAARFAVRAGLQMFRQVTGR